MARPKPPPRRGCTTPPSAKLDVASCSTPFEYTARTLARNPKSTEEPGTITKLSRDFAPRSLPSAQLKIKGDRRNGLDPSAIDRRRLCAPPFHRLHCRVGQNWLALQYLLYFDPAIRFNLYLQLYDPLNPCPPREFRVDRVRRGNEPLEKIARVLSQSAKKGYLEFVHPTLKPVTFFFERERLRDSLPGLDRLDRHEIRFVPAIDPLPLLANERVAQSRVRIEKL